MGKSISQLVEAAALTGSEIVEIAQLSAAVIITATTISAQASDNSYNDSAGGFVSAGFAVGMRVNVTGFTGDTANNIYSGVITSVTAGKITIGGTDGDVIVDDAAGESVTITAWESRRADYGGGGGGGGTAVTIISPDTSTAHTATADDDGGVLIFDSASDCTLTLPQTSTEALSAGFHLLALNKGGGNLKIALQGSDTLEGISLWADPTQAVTVIKETAGSPNAYRLIGNNWLPSAVENDALTAPPSTPAVGAVYIVAATATGSWAGQEDMFAIHIGSDAYEFANPAGVVYEKTSAIFIGWTGSAWAAV